MEKVSRIIDVCMLSAGVSYSLANIQTILGVVMLSIQIAWLATKFIIKLVNKIRAKENLDDLDNEIDTIIDTIKDVKDDLTKEEENSGNDSEP